MFLLRAHVGEYFCQVCAISDMVRCRRLSAVLRLLDAFSSSSFLWFSASCAEPGVLISNAIKESIKKPFKLQWTIPLIDLTCCFHASQNQSR